MSFNWKVIFSHRKLIGIYLILAGVLIILKFIFPTVISSLIIALSVLLILSIDVVIHSIKQPKLFGLLGSGASVALAALLGMIIILFHWNIGKIWPLFGFCVAGGLIFSFFVADKRRMSILIPGIFSALMSSLILCFTTKLITLDSKYLLWFSTALLLMLSGIMIMCQGEHKSSEEELNKQGKEHSDEK